MSRASKQNTKKNSMKKPRIGAAVKMDFKLDRKMIGQTAGNTNTLEIDAKIDLGSFPLPI